MSATSYSNYHDLYNTALHENEHPSEAKEPSPWTFSHIGISHWSPHEKEAFFIALDRKGQDDIKGISLFIGTKSEPEVRCFIIALRDGLAEQMQVAKPLSEFSAAAEVSQECDIALEVASGILSQHQLAVEEDVEKKCHGRWWLLDDDSSVVLETVLYIDQLPLQHKEIEDAARLLNVPQMIELSTQLFMNSKDLEANWTTWLNGKSGPGLYGTTLVDFYKLVVEITKRLVSSSIFLAESRHHLQLEILGRGKGCTVKHRDVQAACELLGLKEDRKAGWITLPRRCNVDVYKHPMNPRTKQQPLSYEEVEQYLATDDQTPTKIRSPAVKGSEIVPTKDTAISHDGDYLMEDSEDERAELLDTLASREEELCLWETIGQKPMDQPLIEIGEDMNLSRASKDHDRVPKDWRKNILYRSPWQTATGTPSEELFAKRTIVRRNPIIAEAGLASDTNDPSSVGSIEESESGSGGEGGPDDDY